MRNSKEKQVEEKPCPNYWTAKDLLDLALMKTNSESLSLFAVQFDKFCKFPPF
jgi:hypothetical protein